MDTRLPPPPGPPPELRVAEVLLDGHAIHLRLQGGCRLAAPDWPSLRRLSPAQVARWEGIDDGYTVRWPTADGGPGPGPTVRVLDIVWDELLAAAVAAFEQGQGTLAPRFAALSGRDRELCALCWLDADVHNGGLLQFLGNWGLAVCAAAHEGLARIQAHHAAEAVRAFMALLARLADDPRLLAPADVPGLLTAAERQQVAHLERAYRDAPEDLARLGVGCYWRDATPRVHPPSPHDKLTGSS